MAIRLYESISREYRELRPSHTDGVYRFYNCGPTVYAPAHIGNFRTFVVNDLIRRLLELEFGPDKVKHVRNLTDVDDKTIRRSREEKRPLAEVTKQWTDKFHADCAALNCLTPHVEPTATGHICEQVDMIAQLEKKGHAYRAADGSVYFKVASFPEYGRLSHLKERELKLGTSLKPQTADADEKEDGSDFALWKAHKPDDGDVGWESPWGRGRPGWHIECSAMSKKHLGETIDLHTGGVDLLFPHHENEIAQSECCNGATFSQHWYHSEHLLVDGKKMSKSLGNLYTLDDLRKIQGPLYDPLAVRFVLLNGHPRKQLNFVLESFMSARAALARLRHFDEQIRVRAPELELEKPKFAGDWGPFKAAWDSLCDDLNVPEALGHIFTVLNERSILSFDGAAAITAGLAFRQICWVLGLEFWRFTKEVIEAPAEVVALAEQRWAAKKAKDFASADRLRGELAAAGWTMLDRKDGYSLEPAKKA